MTTTLPAGRVTAIRVLLELLAGLALRVVAKRASRTAVHVPNEGSLEVQLNHELSGHYLIQTGVRFKSSAATQRFRSKLT